INDADYYLAAGKKFLGQQAITDGITNFEALYLQTTALRAVLDTPATAKLVFGDNIKTYERLHYERILFQLDQLALVPELPGSKFVWAHIAAPHTPYVFNRDGSYKATNQGDGMTEEIIYLNQRVIPLLKNILQKSKTPPIIILQADHSKFEDAHQKMHILNAYYLPDGKNSMLYPTITPVNTFRVVLNAYFGGQYPLLPDRSFYSLYDGNPTQLQEVPIECMGK
ncbi:MAG: hypothetical protein HGA86_08640, partial [Anaerolineaceae bacterium]|nr:hypothetical protein [Anaerolineaceae bacterium]